MAFRLTSTHRLKQLEMLRDAQGCSGMLREAPHYRHEREKRERRQQKIKFIFIKWERCVEWQLFGRLGKTQCDCHFGVAGVGGVAGGGTLAFCRASPPIKHRPASLAPKDSGNKAKEEKKERFFIFKEKGAMAATLAENVPQSPGPCR